MGYNALNSAGGDYNVSIGMNSLVANTANDNIAVGYGALTVNTTGSRNTAVGRNALTANTTAAYNTGLGYEALSGVTTGSYNIGIGKSAGYNVTDGTRNILIGSECQTSSPGGYNQTVIGYQVTGYTHNTFTLGYSTTDTTITFGNTSWSAPSDQRLKEEITTSTAGLSFVNDLRPVTFKWKKEKDIPTNLAGYKEGSETRYKTDTTEHGFIAQEVKAAIDAHSEIKDGFDMWSEDGSGGRQRIADGALTTILVKAIQELSAENKALMTRIQALENA
jgi:hypothetical protein